MELITSFHETFQNVDTRVFQNYKNADNQSAIIMAWYPELHSGQQA